jgi:hypothetical protein
MFLITIYFTGTMTVSGSGVRIHATQLPHNTTEIVFNASNLQTDKQSSFNAYTPIYVYLFEVYIQLLPSTFRYSCIFDFRFSILN